MGEGVSLPAGGGSGAGFGSVLRLLNESGGSSFSVQDTAREALSRYSWSSVDAEDGSPTGKGTASWFVGDKRVAMGSVEQGEQSFNILPYLESGVANRVKLTVEDAYGATRSRIWTVTKIAFSLTWDLEQMSCHDSASMAVRLIPTGMGEKTLRVLVDGEPYFTQSVASTGRTVTVELPRFEFAPLPADSTEGKAVFRCDLNGDGMTEVIGEVALTTCYAVEKDSQKPLATDHFIFQERISPTAERSPYGGKASTSKIFFGLRTPVPPCRRSGNIGRKGDGQRKRCTAGR